MKGANVRARRPSFARWRLVAVAICYIAGLIVIGNLAFGNSMFLGASTSHTRTGAYNTRLPLVAPVDSGKVAKAVIEAAGGQPTIGQPLPADAPAPASENPSTPPVTTASISAPTTPTYGAVSKSTTLSYADWLALIQTYQAQTYQTPTSETPPSRTKNHNK